MPDEKKCKYCAMMIPKEAKICPHCRKKQGTSFLVGLLAVIFVLFMIGMIGSFIEHPNNSASTVQQDALTAKGKIVKKKHITWDNDICNTIGEKKVSIGMTKEQVIASWGKAYKINTTITPNGNSEQWIMNNSFNSDYLYFEGNKLISMQQTK